MTRTWVLSLVSAFVALALGCEKPHIPRPPPPAKEPSLLPGPTIEHKTDRKMVLSRKRARLEELVVKAKRIEASADRLAPRTDALRRVVRAAGARRHVLRTVPAALSRSELKIDVRRLLARGQTWQLLVRMENKTDASWLADEIAAALCTRSWSSTVTCATAGVTGTLTVQPYTEDGRNSFLIEFAYPRPEDSRPDPPVAPTRKQLTRLGPQETRAKPLLPAAPATVPPAAKEPKETDEAKAGDTAGDEAKDEETSKPDFGAANVISPEEEKLAGSIATLMARDCAAHLETSALIVQPCRERLLRARERLGALEQEYQALRDTIFGTKRPALTEARLLELMTEATVEIPRAKPTIRALYRGFPIDRYPLRGVGTLATASNAVVRLVDAGGLVGNVTINRVKREHHYRLRVDVNVTVP